MKKIFRLTKLRFIVSLAFTGLLCAAYVSSDPGTDMMLNGADDSKVYPLVLQSLDYTENPVDIPNPDRGFYQAAEFVVNMGALGKIPPGDYDIFLKTNDPKETSANRRCVQFANQNTWNSSLGADCCRL